MDDAYMDKITNKKSGTKYLLVAVDVLSRYLRVQPLKNRYATTVKIVFLKMINIDDPLSFPNKIWVDQEKEFTGVFAKFCADKKIEVYHTYSEPKSCVAERFNRVLKSIINKNFEHSGSFR